MTVKISKDDFICFKTEEELVEAYVLRLSKAFPKLEEKKIRLAFGSEIRSLRTAFRAWQKAFGKSARFGVLPPNWGRVNNPAAGYRRRGGPAA